MLIALSLLLLLLILFPSEKAVASKQANHTVVAQYTQLEVGERYQLPLSIQPGEKQSYTEIQQVRIKSGDSLASIFKRVKLTHKDVLKVTQSGDAATEFLRLIPGKNLDFEFAESGELLSVKYHQDRLTTVVAKRSESGFVSSIELKDKDIKTTYFEGVIDSSFWKAAVEAGLNDNLIMNFTNIFAWDIDFGLDIRQGDKFYALVEQVYVEGEFVGYGDILAAEFYNQDEPFAAVRHQDGRYYTAQGDSMRKAFLRAPVNFKYISSNFNPRRYHPVQKRVKAHRGVDYAASVGTPVQAAGDGRVVKSSYDRFNGHHVFIEHGGGITTKYIHFSKRKVRRGQKVKQGQLIGLVGATGLAAGPHLHYEFLVNGVHRNPRTVSLPKANPLKAKEKQQFIAFAQQQLSLLNHNKQLLLAMR